MAGEPSYVELGVPDADRALAFYGAVLGWSVDRGAGMTQVDTATLSIGIHGGDPEAHFEVMFAVPDLDAALSAVAAGGGEMLGAVNDSAGFGRWAECRDDQGVRFGLREHGPA
jgi:predicted enzyme related to lactoylglutathione lyase